MAAFGFPPYCLHFQSPFRFSFTSHCVWVCVSFYTVCPSDTRNAVKQCVNCGVRAMPRFALSLHQEPLPWHTTPSAHPGGAAVGALWRGRGGPVPDSEGPAGGAAGGDGVLAGAGRPDAGRLCCPSRSPDRGPSARRAPTRAPTYRSLPLCRALRSVPVQTTASGSESAAGKSEPTCVHGKGDPLDCRP